MSRSTPAQTVSLTSPIIATANLVRERLGSTRRVERQCPSACGLGVSGTLSAHDTAARRRETDDTDTVLGVLPAAPTTFVTKGWSTERLIAAAVRDLRAHIVCDFHVASGAYSVHPDHVGYATLRPTNMAEFDALWGAICSTNGANGRGCPVPAFSDSLTVNRRT